MYRPPYRPYKPSTPSTKRARCIPSSLRKVILTRLSDAPRISRTKARSSESECSNSAAPPSRLVIVIDDSPTICKVVETTLQREGYQTKSFPNGKTALSWLLNPTTIPPALIILDLCLPDMDGYAILRKLNAQSRFTNTVTIIISRRDGPIDKIKGRLAGAKEYLPKPFTRQKLLDMVQIYVPAEPDTHP